ncbi:uncharacterized protein [Anabrus simplex]|uniref:uncharacterized protein n=1 Tax=Anabrus simplex TaxID=316456 RepID=UPI0035A33C12
MPQCCAYNCTAVGVHSFPKDPEMREKWRLATKRLNFKPGKHTRICSAHFLPSDYLEESIWTGLAHSRRFLKRDAVPSVFSWHKEPHQRRELWKNSKKICYPHLTDESITVVEETQKDLFPSNSVSEKDSVIDEADAYGHVTENMNDAILQKENLCTVSSFAEVIDLDDASEHRNLLPPYKKIFLKEKSLLHGSSVESFKEYSIQAISSNGDISLDGKKKIKYFSEKTANACVSESEDRMACEDITVTDSIQQEIENVDKYRSTYSQTMWNRRSYFCLDDFRNDSEGLMYFTGLESYEKFCLVLNTLGPAAHELQYRWNQVINASVEDQLFLTLMKLRRNYSDYELSKFFGISKTTVSNIIVTWINFMYLQWSELNIWPCRDIVDHYMPKDFRNIWPNARVIIDTINIPRIKPKIKNRKCVESKNNKNKFSFKILVGSTPGGLMSFCSSAFRSPTTDRQTVEYSDLVDLCEKGDLILTADVFDIQDLFQIKNIDVCPIFAKDQGRFPGLKTISNGLHSRKVHLERVFNIAHVFRILRQELNAYYLPLISRIFFVCLMLSNFREDDVMRSRRE